LCAEKNDRDRAVVVGTARSVCLWDHFETLLRDTPHTGGGRAERGDQR
jgi:hypothetical protein